jgi:hypothetical protein
VVLIGNLILQQDSSGSSEGSSGSKQLGLVTHQYNSQQTVVSIGGSAAAVAP